MTPQTIDRYEIREQLGRGGMATVYHAYDPHFGRDVAIKVLPREFLHDPTFRARFELEVKAIATLEHSAIVPVYDFGEHEGQPFLVMRYLPGGSLADRIKAGSLSLDETIATLERVGAALDSAHQQGVIHRDVKPGNILFDRHGDAYLSDFGIVKLSEATAQLTGSGIIGTPAYMAPEMADPGGMSPSIDVYALGVTLYEILTGKLPFDADTPVGVLMAHMNKPVPDVRLVRSDLPESVQAVIERAMAKDPSERYQSAGDLAADLRAAVAAPGEATPETTPVPLPSKAGAAAPARRRGIPGWVWVVGGVGALLVVGLVVGVLVLGSLAGRLFGTPEPGEEAARSEKPAPTEEKVPADTPASTAVPPTSIPAGGGDEQPPGDQARVAVVLDIGGENDRGFNEYTLEGARDVAEELGLDFAYAASKAAVDYERYIESFVDEGYNLIITVGYLMADATAAAAVGHPDVHFVIIDVEYDSGSCPVEGGQEVEDCYAEVLTNVTSLTFAEDEAGYLAGMLAGCMSETGVVGSVAGAEIPPVVRYVTGFQTGARNANPGIETLNVYIPDFTDSDAGYLAGMEQIAEGADIIFGVGGGTGNGSLLAAYDVGVMAIGVDIDQYYSYPEVSASLITSATKNMDVAVGEAIRLFVAGQLEAGVRLATVANGGVGLAPYHDWEDAIPLECKMLVDHAYEGLVNGTIVTGY